jgi:nucleoside-diphosphate-sugar epimerase
VRIIKVIITGGSGFIGTNLVEKSLENGWEPLNIDVAEPKNHDHAEHWRKVDLLDRESLINAFVAYKPDVVLHMGARTDLDERHDPEGYAANIDGVANVIEAVRRAGSVGRTVFASSRLVCEIGYTPRSDTDYRPSTLYGESKVRGEMLVRRAAESLSPWVIVRPTSIWGPWFGEPYRNFFASIAGGIYMHPGRHNPRKSYGHVGNTVYQIERILEAPVDKINGKTLYLCDYPPLRLKDWANQIQKALGTRPIKTAPMPLLRLAAAAGDAGRALGWRYPPLTRFRLNNLVTEMVYDTGGLESIAGALPFSMEEGVAATADWLRNHDR